MSVTCQVNNCNDYAIRQADFTMSIRGAEVGTFRIFSCVPHIDLLHAWAKAAVGLQEATK